MSSLAGLSSLSMGKQQGGPRTGCMRQNRQSRAIIVHPRFAKLEKHVTWSELPQDALVLVAEALSSEGVRSLARFSLVNKSCKAAADTDMLWRQLCMDTFCIPQDHAPPCGWKELYKFHHDVLYNVLLCQATDHMMQQRLAGLGNGQAFHIPLLA